jgi:CheY-like chemotaxis protein
MAHILFVDDDHITLEILGKAAELLGHKPILLDIGKSAVSTAEEEQPDLIMMDMMMPDTDGLTVLSELRSRPNTANIPVVILSAGSSWDDSDRVKAAGAQAYLNKPVSLTMLMDTIQKYTNS